MSATVMPPGQFHRKPIPGRGAAPPPPQPPPSLPQQQQQHLPPTMRQHQYPPDPRTYSTTSNTVAPAVPPMSANRNNSMYSMQPQGMQYPPQPQQHQYQQQQQQQHQSYSQHPSNPARRTHSNSTASSTSLNLQRASTATSLSSNGLLPRRSTSSRSNSSSASPTSYVALMRKQKATVWCDQAQHVDPRFLAQQRTARMKAAKEVAGSTLYGRSSMSSNGFGPGGGSGGGGIRSKIRHHGAVKASTYTGGANLSGAGVPMRLSASEVDDENDSDDDDSKYMNYHQRNGSMGLHAPGSRFSARSGGSPNARPYSNGSTPPLATAAEADSGQEDETPMPGDYDGRSGDYFAQRGGKGGSGGSGTAEDEDRFGEVGKLPASKPWSEAEAAKKVVSAEELRRRGSVDDRSMTMTGQRLFVANPDLSD